MFKNLLTILDGSREAKSTLKRGRRMLSYGRHGLLQQAVAID